MNSLDQIQNTLNDINESCTLLGDNLRSHIFPDINLVDLMSFVPSWVRDAGNSAESELSKVDFEKFVSENKSDIIHRFLFLYDCDMLVASLQDRFSMIGGLVKEFYKNMKFGSSHNLKDFDSATMEISESYAPLFACLNSIFIYLGSSFDLLAKVCYESRIKISRA